MGRGARTAKQFILYHRKFVAPNVRGWRKKNGTSGFVWTSKEREKRKERGCSVLTRNLVSETVIPS